MKVLLTFLIIFSLPAYADVYKWVDENGGIHFGSKPPVVGSEKMSPGANGRYEPVKAIPDEASEMISGMKAFMMTDHGDETEANCPDAVKFITTDIEIMSTNLQKNFQAGYVTESRYMEVMSELNKLGSKVSLADCQGATGNYLGFYQCMSGGHNMVVMCADKHHID